MNNDFSFNFRNKKASHPELEESLYIWYCNKRDLLIRVSDEMLLAKAKVFGDNFYGLYNFNFKYSSGWLTTSKQDIVYHNILSL